MMNSNAILDDLNAVCNGWVQKRYNGVRYYLLGPEDGYHVSVDDRGEYTDMVGFTAGGSHGDRSIVCTPSGEWYERPSLAVEALRDVLRAMNRGSHVAKVQRVLNEESTDELRTRLAEMEGLVKELAEELDAWTHNPRYWGYEDVYTCSECQHYFQDVAGGPTWQDPLSILFDHAWCQLTGFARPPDWHCSAFVARED